MPETLAVELDIAAVEVGAAKINVVAVGIYGSYELDAEALALWVWEFSQSDQVLDCVIEPGVWLSSAVEGAEELPSLNVPVADGRADSSVVRPVSLTAGDDDIT